MAQNLAAGNPPASELPLMPMSGCESSACLCADPNVTSEYGTISSGPTAFLAEAPNAESLLIA